MMGTAVDSARRITVDKFYTEFCKGRIGPPILSRDVYIADLGVGETLTVEGFDNVEGLRDSVSENMLYGFADSSPGPEDKYLSERRFHHEIDELNLTYKITRQE